MRGHNGAATASSTLQYPPGIVADDLLPVTLADALALKGTFFSDVDSWPKPSLLDHVSFGDLAPPTGRRQLDQRLARGTGSCDKPGRHFERVAGQSNKASTSFACLISKPTASHVAVLWIGVNPSSLTSDDGARVDSRGLNLLEDHQLADIELHIRESLLTRSALTKLFKPRTSSSSLRSLARPTSRRLQRALGIPICAKTTPSVKGAAGFLLDRNTKRLLLLVTACHLLLPPSECSYILRPRES
ncbi:hypothetical protein K438DRAFT_1818217 [Mycena galopus ATCC 62051]|nr:hypothetical protein K438DRAFT_1818217 [Mycena galopus ATCC 62051]